MEQWITDLANNYGPLIYLVILVWTFFEGETVVILTGALISGGDVQMSVWFLTLFAFCGSFAGDQAWFYIGRRYGTPLLKRWPTMAVRIQSAFTHLRKHENLFILTFRFVYGLRNLSPFIIGMAGVSRTKFFVLNLIAATLWANMFAWGGYTLGRMMEIYLGESSRAALLGIIVVVVLYATFNCIRRHHKVGAIIRACPEAPTTHVADPP